MFEFHSGQLVSARLSGTIVRLDGVFTYIEEAGWNERTGGYYVILSDGSTRTIVPENISYNNMLVGMMELAHEGIMWTARLPVRRWKVGLNKSNFCYRAPGSKVYSMFSQRWFNTYMPNIMRMLNQQYGVQETKIAHGQGALSQHYGLQAGSLYRKALWIGNHKQGRVELMDKYSFLREEMNKEIPCTR